MPLAAGTRLGPYGILSPLGAHAAVGDWDGAVPLLQQAVDQREGILLAFRFSAEMRAMEAHPRTKGILEQADAIRRAM